MKTDKTLKRVPDSKLKESMTPRQFAAAMKKIFVDQDPDCEHRDADDLMCELLVSLGYSAGVKVFREAEKWYA